MEEVKEEIKSNVGVTNLKCENCGGSLKFDPASQKLYCDHCGSYMDFNKNRNVQELAIAEIFKNDNSWSEEAEAYRCENCGAVIVLDKLDVATSCPFCGTPQVVKNESINGIKPNVVIPFSFNTEEAVKKSKTWARKLWFAPSSFKKNISVDSVKGVYTPCFTFDSLTCSNYAGRLGENYTVRVGAGKDSHTETRTRYYNVSGCFNDAFNDLIIEAGPKISEKVLNKLLPFNFKISCVYDKKFLSGFMANLNDKGVVDSWYEAQAKMDEIIKEKIKREYNADVVDYLNVSTIHTGSTYKFILVPVYIGNFNFKKKLYNFYINGDTGKVYGKHPLSALRIALVGIGILLLIAGVYLLVSYT